MEAVQLFLKEITEELLYNIVYDANEIDHRDLSDAYEKKTGHRPMDFFGFGNNTGRGWLDFVKGIPGLQGKKIISICDNSEDFSDDSDDSDDSEYETNAYKTFNTKYLNEIDELSPKSVATYREMLLIKCCEIMKDNFNDLSSCKDTNSNTPLHFIAGLPGITYNCSTLVKYLLQAGVDPLKANDHGQTFLHIIFGRFMANNDGAFGLCFNRERIATTEWFVEDRVHLLDLLFKELSQAQITLLAKAQDENGNTVVHECALSAPIEEHCDESEIYEKLLKFGASLRVSNNTGELPIHYAFNPKAFQIFIQNGAVRRARNDRDETPVLFMLKYIVSIAFPQTESTELSEQGFSGQTTTSNRFRPKVSKLLENLTKILEDADARETAWIPNIEGNVVVNILLEAIRFGSCSFLYSSQLRLSLVKLLGKLVLNASSNDMRRQNKKGQSFLHVLLDFGKYYGIKITEDTFILQSLEILLKHNADVNAVDFQGCTPMDIAYNDHPDLMSFYGKCRTWLTEYGALKKRGLENISSATTSQSLLQSELDQRIYNLRIQNVTRKLRSCPKRHWKSAKRLTGPLPYGHTVVGKYRYSNEDPIGSGAFSMIFVAIKDEKVDEISGKIECRAYALKRLDKAKVNAEEIKREITTLLSTSGKCENIINCCESIEDQFFQYLCLDLMDGDLDEFVINGSVNAVLKADPTMPMQITNELIKGLVYLHQHDFIHRDLKPGNILYTTDPTLHFKIADFGLTKNTSTLRTTTSTRGSGVAMTPGTRCWLAPELVSMASKEHTKESDIFSLGLVLHYLLTLGKHPFVTAHEEPAHVIERKIVEMEIHIDKALHPEAISVLKVLLTKDPSKRTPAKYLHPHPFFWKKSKKIEFLKAVADQEEAAHPGRFPNSSLEQSLQMSHTGKITSWDRPIENLYKEMTAAWKKKYRTNKVIDLIRFIRNAYAHKQERSLESQAELDSNIFLRKFPSLVLDVFDIVQQLSFDDDESRSSIRQALNL